MQEKVIKVGSATDPNALASSIQRCLNEDNVPLVKVIGAGALNQAMKAIIICNGFLARNGEEILVSPSFRVNEEQKTLMVLKILHKK